MDWKELKVHTTNEAEEAVCNIVNEEGANGVVIEDPADLTKEKRTAFGEIYELDPSKYPPSGVVIKAYFIDDQMWKNKKKVIRQKISNLQNVGLDIGKNKITVTTVQEEDWENEWKKYFKPLKVTNRFMIVPNWENYETEDQDELVITIDPGMAFGTGTHPTTILSLRALEKTVQNNDTVIDVGVGSGILSIGSILLGANHVYAYDLDEVAINSTIINRRLNNFENKISVKKNDLLKGIDKRVNIVVSNILADILLNLVDEAWDNLLVGGYFITSGIIEVKEKIVSDAIRNKGFTIIETNMLENWVSIIAKKE